MGQMVIQLPEWDGWRIAGCDRDWQVQELRKRKGEAVWEGRNFFNALEHAVGFAYERTLRERGEKATGVNEWLISCKVVKKQLLDAVRKAVRDGE